MDRFPSGIPNQYWMRDIAQRDRAAFAMKEIVAAAAEADTPSTKRLSDAIDAAKGLCVELCPGCRTRSTDTEQHTCVKEGT